MEFKTTMLSFSRSGNSLLGLVFAASGYRVTKRGPKDACGRQMDWALIEMAKDRLGEDKVCEFYGGYSPEFTFRYMHDADLPQINTNGAPRFGTARFTPTGGPPKT